MAGACGQKPALRLLQPQQRSIIEASDLPRHGAIGEDVPKQGAHPLHQGVVIVSADQTARILKLREPGGASSRCLNQPVGCPPGGTVQWAAETQQTIHRQITTVRMQPGHESVQIGPVCQSRR